MGVDIKPVKTKSYKWKQPGKDYLPRCPFRGIISGPSGTGKGVLTQSLILSPDCNAFERVYYCSGSAALDHNLRVVADYAEKELKQDPERDSCLIEGWDEKALERNHSETAHGRHEGQEDGARAAASDTDRCG